MNSMNINSASFGAKLPVQRIKLARNVNNVELPVDNYVREMLDQHGSMLERAANYVDRDVVLAQKGKLLLVNSGAKTSVVDMREMKSGDDFINGILHNICINA